ncbi:type I polyketide synthase [Mycolicibacterium sp. 018/SC-01/001]|uniref:type I polyketide synthase n=1 Tax=Mycolicibacterium sp. 018/SC-01/001 TaxID=2592069 RepID=UPI00117F2B1D|nr:type I polyketide synthase [Mycolicibacterium sp. 018/SC-01/001]TRW78344.1 type I polyketide synthase [Mycolicibacterium sp. 018/SC-01/001]
MTRAEQDTREPLAIVGIGCRLPGGVDSPATFWRLLLDGVDATREVPESRWHAARFHDPAPGKAGKMVTRRGGYLDEIDQFDAAFFGISPREANLLDPQQRLLLHATWEALEDGGIPADSLAGTDVGVFIGGFTLDYQLLQNQGRTSRFRFKPHSATGMMMTMLANRISYAFDFRGPSMAVDTACSSSLVAVHLAAQSIWNGDSQLALAGGVNIIVGPNTAIAESKSGFLSSDGRCKAFDASADGYARGEGGAVVVLKPLQQAVRDGDRIYAQILGTAVTQDGHTDGITVPSEDAQRSAITTALRRAGVAPTDIGYVEAHGTGTPVGDPVETRALAGALAADRTPDNPLLIGSVKTNIGHLEAGAGVAGLIKAALTLQHGRIPASLHLSTPSSPLAELNLDIPRSTTPFPAGRRRIAGVNSFGFGGTNAHVVLAEPPSAAPPHAERTAGEQLTLLPVSARSPEALAETARQLADHLETHPDLSLADLGYTLSRRRSHLSHRRALAVATTEEAREQLRELAGTAADSVTGRTGSDAPKLAFVCTGMGPQWWQMCRGLLDTHPVFAASIERTDRELARYTGWSLLEELRRDEEHSRMSETEIAQPANFAVQIALADELAHVGIVPDAVIGHSAGEVAAHHLAGLLTFEQAVAVIYHRSRLQQRTTGMGRMLAVGRSADALLQTLDDATVAEFGRRVSIAAINSPFAVTVAGDEDVLADIVRQLDAAEVFNRYLAVKVPYHTHYMDLVRDDLTTALEGLSSAPAHLPLYSTVTGERLTEYTAGAAYWWQNTRATVLFEAAARRMLDDGYTHFVELGPHPVLASSILEIAGSQGVVVVATQRRGEDDARSLLNGVAALYGHGHDIDWHAVHPGGAARIVTLPTYPWQSKRFWHETQEAAEDLHYTPVHPLLGQPVAGAHPTWEAEFSVISIPFLADHQVQGTVVVPGAVYLEMGLAAATVTYGAACSVDNLLLHRALLLDDTCDPLVRTTLNEDTGAIEFTAFTGIGGGEFGWLVTATAELNTLPVAPTHDHGAEEHSAEALDADEFYARTTSLGFSYGEAFQPVRDVTGGEGWARAQLRVPAAVARDIDAFSFHPALLDGALQGLFGTSTVGEDATQATYLPTRIRHCAVYGRPEPDMTVHVRVVAAGREEIESDITVVDRLGQTLVVLQGFTVQSLTASSAMSTERIDRGLYSVQWDDRPAAPVPTVTTPGTWLILSDTVGFGSALAQHLSGHGHRVVEVSHQSVAAITETSTGFAVDPHRGEHMRELVDRLHQREGGLTALVDLWPIDIYSGSDDRLGVHALLHTIKALAGRDGVPPRVHIVTANAQPALGTEDLAVDQATVWGLGRVVGHQEFPEMWGSLVDIDDADDPVEVAGRLYAHLVDDEAEDQIALRGDRTLAPRLLPCPGLTKPFPTKLNATATYVVTGGTGALGRSVALYLAERGARHITLLSRRELPPRASWPHLDATDAQYAAVETVRRIERLGAHVRCAAVDITDAEHVERWRDEHDRAGAPPIRGIVHAAGSVDDRLLVSMTEEDFATVMAPKIAGTRLLHNAFEKKDLDFFVMFGSAGSVIASPGQANYAAANAFLDAFAHYRQARGLPALTIGWGPWSVGMVEELKLEKIYANRGIELITPRAGVRILDRLLSQKVAHVVAITADWNRARQGFGTHLPAIYRDLDTGGDGPGGAGAESLLDTLSALPDTERLPVVTEHVRGIVAAVFDCAAEDVEPDVMLDDLGLDSMMAMEFRVRINSMFSIDLPVLEILRGVTVNSLAARILAELRQIHADSVAAEAAAEAPSVPTADDLDHLIDGLSDAELQALLADIEGSADAQ